MAARSSGRRVRRYVYAVISTVVLIAARFSNQTLPAMQAPCENPIVCENGLEVIDHPRLIARRVGRIELHQLPKVRQRFRLCGLPIHPSTLRQGSQGDRKT